MRIFGQQFAAGVLRNPISAITSLIGGAIGSSAAESGAAGINGADTGAAASTLATTAAVNPTILAAANTAGQNVIGTAATAGTNATNAAEAAGTGATTAATNAAAGVTGAATTANGLLNPYASAGTEAEATLAAGTQAGGQFDSTPTLAQLQIAPNYEFQLQQGENALARSAAARGGVLSGGDVKSTEDYIQGDAASAYQQAFNNYETSTQNNYANVAGVANTGLTALQAQGTNDLYAATYGGNINENAAQYAGTANIGATEYAATAAQNASQYAGTANINATDLAGQNTINAQNTANNYNVAGATALAQGKMGAANAWTGALNGIGNAAMYGGVGMSLGSLLGNPAIPELPAPATAGTYGNLGPGQSAPYVMPPPA